MTKKDSGILQPILSDRVLMALLHMKFVPVSFLMQKASIKTDKRGIKKFVTLMSDLKSFKQDCEEESTTIFMDASANFQLVKKSLHINIGAYNPDAVKNSEKFFDAQDLLKSIKNNIFDISQINHESASEYAKETYQPLRVQYEKYERFLKACEGSIDLQSALKKTGMTKESLKSLKNSMARYGLAKDMQFGANIFISGALLNQIEKNFYGKPLTDVVDSLLKSSLERIDGAT